MEFCRGLATAFTVHRGGIRALWKAAEEVRPPVRGRPPWRTLIPTVLVPNLLHGSGQGAAIPAIPIAALELSGSYASAAIVAAMLTAGQLLSTLPAGWFVGRFNEKTAMIVAGTVTGISGLGAFWATTQVELMASILIMGIGVSVFTMARHAWITVAIPADVRGRTLSVVAGATRLGMLVGPFIAAAAFALTGKVSSAFAVVAMTSVVLVTVVSLTRFPGEHRAVIHHEAAPRVLQTLWDRRGVLARLGMVMSIVSTVRTTRRILVPLIGVAIGLDEVTIALIVGLASTIDFSLFYIGGLMTDRLGRLWVAVPALLTFGVSHLVLAVVDQLPKAFPFFLCAVITMAVGNGISGGVVATMGSDLADLRNPAAFLSSWRLVSEIGPALAPVAISGITAAASLGTAAAALGALSLLGALVLPRYARRYLPRL